MEFPGLRLFLFLLLIGVDLGVAVYYRYINVSTQVGYVAHLGNKSVLYFSFRNHSNLFDHVH